MARRRAWQMAGGQRTCSLARHRAGACGQRVLQPWQDDERGFAGQCWQEAGKQEAGRVRRGVEATLLGGVCAFALLLWFPLTKSHWFESHEADSYVLRAVAYLEGLRSGELLPRWAGDMYGGFGCPFFIFYPPLVYGLAAVSAPLLGSVLAGLKAVALLATLTAGVSLYLLARQETGRPDAAALAAAVYLAAPYRVWDLYGRGDLAEYTALGFLPLALYGYRRAAAEPVLRRSARFAALGALAHALSVFSHTLLGFYGSGVFVGHCRWPVAARRAPARGAAGRGLCLCAGAERRVHAAGRGGEAPGAHRHHAHW
jgi:hypothetical protein